MYFPSEGEGKESHEFVTSCIMWFSGWKISLDSTEDYLASPFHYYGILGLKETFKIIQFKVPILGLEKKPQNSVCLHESALGHTGSGKI